jgi:transcriptional regulator with XRE-family HTH domain
MLQTRTNGEDWLTVTAEERGNAIKRRREAHGIRYLSEFADRTGVSREAVTKAERGEASEGTYQRLEAWLDAFDHEVGNDQASVEQIEFTVEGDFGVKVTVKGPITDRAELEDSVTKIIRSIRGERPES